MDGVRDAAAPHPPPWVARRRWDVTAYHRMAAAGILHEDDRVELIDGELIEMTPIGGPHIGAIIALTQMFVLAAAGRARVSPQNPVRLGEHSEPEPDLALLRPRDDGYRGGEPPLAADVMLLVEVADSSLRYDRVVKLPLYARHGIPEVWIVDLEGRVVEVCREPGAEGYASVVRVSRDGVLEPLGLPGAAIPVAEILSG